MTLAQQAIEIDLSGGGGHPLHQSRSFERLPDHDEAAALLVELATTPCAFAAVATDRPLALYGAGNLGRLAADFIRAVRREVVMVLDRNAGRVADDGKWIKGPLLRPDEVTDLTKREVQIAVSIATAPYVPIERALAERGFRNIVPFYDWAENFRHLHPLSNGWFAPPFTAEDRTSTVRVLARWNDDTSRAHHLQFLAWRRLREEWTFEKAPIPDCSRFFIPEIAGALHKQELFLDGGAYHGGVTQTFVKQTSGAFKQVVAIEPDPANRATLARELQSWLPDDRRITMLDCALSESEGEATFHDGLGYASQLSNTGRTGVTLRTIDALGIAPTFIKLHLEGGELAALKGAEQTLTRYRPIVAATVYHNDDGIWKTARWLMETLPGYRFLFRAHAWCGTGAVVYAIPNERSASW